MGNKKHRVPSTEPESRDQNINSQELHPIPWHWTLESVPEAPRRTGGTHDLASQNLNSVRPCIFLSKAEDLIGEAKGT